MTYYDKIMTYCLNYDIKSKNDDILSQNYDMKGQNYVIMSTFLSIFTLSHIFFLAMLCHNLNFLDYGGLFLTRNI